VRLTDKGEAAARALCGLPSLSDALVAVRTLAGCSHRPPTLLSHLWVYETLATGVDYADTTELPARQRLMDFENRLLPALARGWVRSLSDIERRVSYALTPAGWSQLDAGDVPLCGKHCEPDPGARQLYDERLAAALAHFDSADVDAREIGPVPLPAAFEGMAAAGPWAT
jgi:hypothetical protein